MTDEEKLKYAHKHYVVGVKYKEDDGRIRTIERYDSKTDNPKYTMQGSDVWCTNGMKTSNVINNEYYCSNPYIYNNGVWKEIISYPEGFVKDEVINDYSIF